MGNQCVRGWYTTFQIVALQLLFRIFESVRKLKLCTHSVTQSILRKIELSKLGFSANKFIFIFSRNGSCRNSFRFWSGFHQKPSFDEMSPSDAEVRQLDPLTSKYVAMSMAVTCSNEGSSSDVEDNEDYETSNLFLLLVFEGHVKGLWYDPERLDAVAFNNGDS